MDIMSITYRNLYSEMMTFFIATDHIMIIFKSILWYWANIKYLKFYGVWFWHSLLRWKIFHLVTYRPKLCSLPIQRCFVYFFFSNIWHQYNEFEFDLFLKSFEIDWEFPFVGSWRILIETYARIIEYAFDLLVIHLQRMKELGLLYGCFF